MNIAASVMIFIMDEVSDIKSVESNKTVESNIQEPNEHAPINPSGSPTIPSNGIKLSPILTVGELRNGTSVALLNIKKKSSILDNFRIFVVCWLTYLLALIPAFFLLFIGGILSFGGGSAGLIVIPFVLATLLILPLAIQSILFRNPYRSNPRVYKEAFVTLGIFILVYYLTFFVVAFISKGRNSTPTDVLILYLSQIIFGLGFSAIFNTITEKRAITKIETGYFYPGLRLTVVGIIFFVISIVAMAVATYVYGYRESLELEAYHLSEVTRQKEKTTKQQTINNEFRNDKRDWYILEDVTTNDSLKSHTLIERYYEPDRTYSAAGGGTVNFAADLRSEYQNSGQRFEIVQSVTVEQANSVISECGTSAVECRIIDTELGRAKCEIIYSRLDCRLVSDSGAALWLMINKGYQTADPSLIYNSLTVKKSSDIKLTR